MGINMNDAFPSKWLKASDVSADMAVTIAGVTMEDIGNEDRKPVLWLREFDKGVVLNKTNANNISSLYGPDSDSWTGQPMTLATAMVDFQGKSMRALRLYPPRTQTGFDHSKKPQFQTGTPGDPRGNVPPPNGPQDYDDDIPF